MKTTFGLGLAASCSTGRVGPEPLPHVSVVLGFVLPLGMIWQVILGGLRTPPNFPI